LWIDVSRRSRSLVLLAAILLLGMALRLAPWGQNRFLEDEALYAVWGLQIATGADPMLDAEPVDKPPLHAYVLAASFWLTGSTEGGRAAETAARLPSLLASVVSIALVFALGQALYPGEEGNGVPALAALLLALSPFDVLFASTAFTDPLLVALGLGALLAAARGHGGAAGLLAGLAAATKQQGLLFLPLILALVALAPGFRRTSLLRFGLGFALVAAGVLAWDGARMQRPGFWQQSLIAYGGLAPAATTTLGERGGDWLRLAGLFWASPWANLLAGLSLVAWLAGAIAGRLPRPGKVDAALGLFTLGYLAAHWLLTFQVWDRYLLPLVPLFALLVARALLALARLVSPRLGMGRGGEALPHAAVLGLVFALTAAGPLLQATASRLPVGGDHGAYDGIDILAATIREKAPAGSVLYHHWLGYHYRFYLYGTPLRLHWYPDVDDLVHDATVYRREPRYIAFPSFRDGRAAMRALQEAGMELLPVEDTQRRNGTVSFRLYRLAGP
jgi:4-amino-4-deoxy-L-arabinose transferase-like glycosyltransferase